MFNMRTKTAFRWFSGGIAAVVFFLSFLLSTNASVVNPSSGGSSTGGLGVVMPTPIPTPAPNAIGVVPSQNNGVGTWVNIYNVTPWSKGFEYLGTPANTTTIGIYSCPREVDLPQNLAGATSGGSFPLNANATWTADTAPSLASTYTVKGTTNTASTLSTLGTVALPTSLGTAPTLTGSGSCASGTCMACQAGGWIEIISGTTHSEVNPEITLTGEEQQQ